MRNRNGTSRAAALLLAVPLALLAWEVMARRAKGDEESAHYQGPGTTRMAAILAKIVDGADADPANVPFWNHKRAEVLRKVLSQQKGAAGQEFQLRLALAQELLYAGQTEEAIKEFTALSDWVKQSGSPGDPTLGTQLRKWLGLAYLRLGEQDNCVRNHNAESCLLPIRPGGYHAIQRGSRMAVEQYTSLLKADADDLSSRWLLNIAYMTLGEYPGKVPEDWLIPPETFASEYEVPRWTDVAPKLGLDRTGLAGGAIMEDFDGDGYLDLMISSSGLRDQLRYYHNNADGTFTERTREAGLIGEVGGLNIIHADYNNDGYPDVLVLRGGWMKEGGHYPMSLLRNNGDGTFEDVTEQAGLFRLHPTQTAVWLDYDNDGWLDLFVGYESGVIRSPLMAAGGAEPKVEPRDERPCELFHNNGDGTFTEVGAKIGMTTVGYVKAVVAGDFNNDGRPDLFISRLGAPKVLYRNDGPVKQEPSDRAPKLPATRGPASPVRPWKFTDVSIPAKVIEPRDSFPAWFFDYDNDGWLDIFVSGYRAINSVADVAADYLGLPNDGETPRLYHNNHDGTFSDVTASAKLNHLLLSMGSNFGDIDNDGWPDIYLGTGAPDLTLLIPNRMFRNAEGKFFQDITTAAGVGHLQKGHAVAFGDIDNDGDQDIYEVIGGAYYGDAYRNVLFLNPGNRNHWITLRLEGVRSNRSAIGARIRAHLENPRGERDVYTTVGTGGSFGGNSLQQEIGLGDAKAIRLIEIKWPASGTTQTFHNVAMDQIVKIQEGDSTLVPVKLKRLDLSGKGTLLPHEHHGHGSTP